MPPDAPARAATGDALRAGRPWPLLARVGLLLLPVLALVLLWRATPLAALLTAEAVRDHLAAGGTWAPAVPQVLAYVLLGLLGFPLNILIMGTAAAFGAWPGIAYAGPYGLAPLGRRHLRGRAAAGRGAAAPPARITAGPHRPRGWSGTAWWPSPPSGPCQLRALRVAVTSMRRRAARAVPGLHGRHRARPRPRGRALLVGGDLSRMLSRPTPGQGCLLLGVLIAWAALTWGLQRAMRRGRGAA